MITDLAIIGALLVLSLVYSEHLRRGERRFDRDVDQALEVTHEDAEAR